MRKPALAEVVERIGCGPTHARYCFTGGGVYTADGSELLLISAITDALATDWHLNGTEKALIVTIVYFGMLIGTMACGPLGDHFGRRICILSSYTIVFISCVASSYAANYITLCSMRFIVGCGIGIGIPAWNALATEITPRQWRMVMQAASYFMFVSGELFSCFLIMLDDPTMENLHWRMLVRWAAVPGLLFGFATLLFMYESPSFLSGHGRYEEGEGVLSINAADNRVADMDVAFKHAEADNKVDSRTMGAQILVLFDRHLLSTTLVCLYTTFMCNTMYYGSLYAFPQVLQDLKDTEGSSTGSELLIGALWELPGICIAIVMGMYLPRKLTLKIATGSCATCLLIFTLGIVTTSPVGILAWHVGYYGLKCWIQVAYAAAYVFSAEVYPTSVRTTGNALCVAGGRLGSMSAPLVFEKMESASGGPFAFFACMAVMTAFNALIIDFAPIEPTTAILAESLADLEESDKLNSDVERSSYGVARSIA